MFALTDLDHFKENLTKFQQGDKAAGIKILQMNHFQSIIGRECSKWIPQYELKELRHISSVIILKILFKFKLPEDSNGGHIISYIDKYLGLRLMDELKRIDKRNMEVSLQSPVGEDGLTLEDTLPDPASLDMEDRIAFKIDMAAALKKLTPNQQTIIQLYFYEGMTLDEIGEHLNRSHQAVHISIQSALSKLRTYLSDYINN